MSDRPVILESMLDRLPRERVWSEFELQEWLEMFEGALRVHYHVPRRVRARFPRSRR